MALAVTFLALIPVLGKSKSVRFWRDRFLLRLPIIGNTCSIIYTERFARSQSSLYQSGLSVKESLEIAGRTIGNRYLEKQLADVVRTIQSGGQLSRAIGQVDGFEKRLAPIIRVGEETGRLDRTLEGLAEHYEYEAEMVLKRMISYVEPVTILIMGAVIGSILLGVMQPIWTMYGGF